MATLYLHIGTHKTGTTAIQNFCEANRRALKRRGYCYPLLPYRFKGVPLHRNGHFLVDPRQAADGSFENFGEAATWHKRVASLKELFRKYPNVILSDEVIWNHSSFTRKGLWKNLKREADALGFQLRVIVYLRRQDQLAQSLWAQRVKTPKNGLGKTSWADAIADTQSWIELDYHRHLEEIAAQTGREAIDVRIYDRERFPGGNVIEDFLRALGLRMEKDFTIPAEDQNTSIGGNALEIKRIINATPNLSYAQMLRAYRAADICYEKEREKVRFSMFSDAELRDFLAKYEQSNRLLSRDYLGGGDESPFPPPEPQAPKWERDNPYMYEAFETFIQTYMSLRGSEYLAWLGRFMKRNGRRLRQMLP